MSHIWMVMWHRLWRSVLRHVHHLPKGRLQPSTSVWMSMNSNPPSSVWIVVYLNLFSSWRGYRDLARLLGESWTKKWGAIRAKQLHRNRETVVQWMVGIVGAHGQLTQSAILRNPRTKYKRSKNVFSVTSIALSCAHICARLLQPLAQSL